MSALSFVRAWMQLIPSGLTYGLWVAMPTEMAVRQRSAAAVVEGRNTRRERFLFHLGITSDDINDIDRPMVSMIHFSPILVAWY
jgi:hypothetical protein